MNKGLLMKEKIKKIMAKSFKILPDEINNETTPMNVKSWDSLGHLNMVIALEEEFNIDFNDDDALKLITYPMILEIITKKIK